MNDRSSEPYPPAKYLVSGDSALVVELGSEINRETNARVHGLYRTLERNPIPGTVEAIPTFRSLLISYDPLIIGFDDLVNRIRDLEMRREETSPPRKTVLIPTVYGGEFGPDIQSVASHNRVSLEEVIHLHSSGEYVVYMIGFTPGFPYLGGLPARLATPRRDTPRTRVAAGSVGIAGGQTGVYPVESPGGWQLIGRTPLKLYDPGRENPVLLEPGDSVRFERIDEKAFSEWE